MKDDKEIDKALGKMLGSYRSTPEKLNFESLHKNYLVQKKLASKAVIAKSAIILLAIVTCITVAGLFVINHPSETKSKNTAPVPIVANDTTSPMTPATLSNSVEKTPGNNPLARIPAPGEKSSPPTLSSVEGKNIAILNGLSEKNITNELAQHDKKISQKEQNNVLHTPSKIKNNKTSLPANNEKPLASKENGPGPLSTTTAKSVFAENSTALQKKKSGIDLPGQDDKAQPVPTHSNNTEPDPGSPVADMSLAPGNTNNITETESLFTPPSPASVTNTVEPDAVILENKVNTGSATPSYSASPSVEQSVASPTSMVVKNHRFSFSAEVSRNIFAYQISPGNTGNTASSEALTAGFDRQPQQAFSGAALVGYKYKNLGINSGVGFLSIENQINTSTSSKTVDLYSMRFNTTTTITNSIVITTTVIPSIDSLIPPTVITSSAITTVTVTRVDTVYTPAGKKAYVIVNGDTVSPQAYLNQVRFFTIPFQINYSFHLLRHKLMLEPQLGIQVGIPVNSYQLRADRGQHFSYAKQKQPLKNSFILLDASLKINYRLRRNTLIYFKQGYCVNSRTIYNTDYSIKYALSNLYSAVGLTLLVD